MSKPNWIKACEDTQKKLEIYQQDYEEDPHFFDRYTNCAFCILLNIESGPDEDDCFECPIFKAGKQVCSHQENWHWDLVNSPDIPHILALWLWLEDLKGMLRRGEL